MFHTDKSKKALQKLSERLKKEEIEIEFFLKKEDISMAIVYKGLEMMGYSWIENNWIRIYKLPAWYIRLRGQK